MRIFNSPAGEPMLLDTAQGLRVLQQAFDAFLSSPSVATSFAATTDGSPAPYDEFLSGLRVTKGGERRLQFSSDRWLELSGSPQDLQLFHECLAPTDGDHRHWRGQPVSLIIEADNSRPEHEA